MAYFELTILVLLICLGYTEIIKSVNRGDTVILPCQRNSSLITTKWRRNNEILSEGFIVNPFISGYERYAVDSGKNSREYNLQIKNTTGIDQAQFTCEIQLQQNVIRTKYLVILNESAISTVTDTDTQQSIKTSNTSVTLQPTTAKNDVMEPESHLPLIISLCIGIFAIGICIALVCVWKKRKNNRYGTSTPKEKRKLLNQNTNEKSAEQGIKIELTELPNTNSASATDVSCEKSENESCSTTTRVVSQTEIPLAIQQLSEKDKGLYLDIIKTQKAKRYYIRIVIIGENGVGKTCLLRRLLGESIEDVKSTDGIDIVNRCKIRLSDGRWVLEKVADKRKAMVSRIRRAIKFGTSEYIHIENNFESQKNQQDANSRIQRNEDESSCNKHIQRKESQHIFKNKEEYLSNKMEDISLNSDKDKEEVKEALLSHVDTLNDEDTLSQSNNLQAKENEIETQLKKVLTELDLELSQMLNEIHNVDMQDEVLVDCGFWDFPGERHLATHPFFLNDNAVHLLVVNIMQDIRQINTTDEYDKNWGSIDYWFDNVHSCRHMENKTENYRHLNPPVIVVCTGIDNCKDDFQEKKNKFCQGLMSFLHDEEKKKHLRRICFVSNRESSDTDIDNLRQSIFEFGKELETFQEILPLRWILLERAFDIMREAGVNIVSLPEITDLTKKCFMDDVNEIILFLKYQHNVGSIIYYEFLKDNVILNPKWLENVFKCLVSNIYDSDIILIPEWKMLQDTGKIDLTLIEKLFEKDPNLAFNKHREHLLNIMELCGIIAKLSKSLNKEQKQGSSTYYMPCMISRRASIVEIKKMFDVENCKCTPWLCMQFAFMPLDFFNNIMCHYISKYSICNEPLTIRLLAIYYGMGVFYLDNSKFVLCFFKNTIAVQLWQLDKDFNQVQCKHIIEELVSVIQRVKAKYVPRKVSYIIKLKCSNGDIHNPVGRLSYRELVDLGPKKYSCGDCTIGCQNTNHFFQTWFADYFETWFPDCSENEDYAEALRKDEHLILKCKSLPYWQNGMKKSLNNYAYDESEAQKFLQYIIETLENAIRSAKIGDQNILIPNTVPNNLLYENWILIIQGVGLELDLKKENPENDIRNTAMFLPQQPNIAAYRAFINLLKCIKDCNWTVLQTLLNDPSEEEISDLAGEQKHDVAKEQKLDLAEEQKTNLNEGQKHDVTEEQKLDLVKDKKHDVAEEQKLDLAEEQNYDVTKEQKLNLAEEQKQDIAEEQKRDLSQEQKHDVAEKRELDFAEERKQDVPAAQKIDLVEEEKSCFADEQNHALNNKQKLQLLTMIENCIKKKDFQETDRRNATDLYDFDMFFMKQIGFGRKSATDRLTLRMSKPTFQVAFILKTFLVNYTPKTHKS